jgi:hypothetical protein
MSPYSRGPKTREAGARGHCRDRAKGRAALPIEEAFHEIDTPRRSQLHQREHYGEQEGTREPHSGAKQRPLFGRTVGVARFGHHPVIARSMATKQSSQPLDCRAAFSRSQ